MARAESVLAGSIRRPAPSGPNPARLPYVTGNERFFARTLAKGKQGGTAYHTSHALREQCMGFFIKTPLWAAEREEI